MRYDAQFVDRLKPPLFIDAMKDTICKCKKLFIGLTTHAVSLLIAVSLDFTALHEVMTHVRFDGFPLPFLSVEVHSFVIDEHFFYRRHLQQSF